jgi:hypothetical protein
LLLEEAITNHSLSRAYPGFQFEVGVGQDVVPETTLQNHVLFVTELTQCRGHIEKVRVRAATDDSAVAAPSPLFRTSDQARPERISRDIPAERELIRVMLDDLILESTLEHVADRIVAPVPPLRIDAVQAFHRPGEVRQGWLDHEVVVIGHRAVIPASDLEIVHDLTQVGHEISVVVLVQKDLHAPVPPCHDVTDQVRGLVSP